MLTQWKDDLKTGNSNIDLQHKEIFVRTNNFLSSLENKKEEESVTEEELQDIVEEMFYFLTDYTETHFTDEEEIQQEYNYPKYEKHKKSHKEFINKIRELKYRYYSSDDSIIELAQQIKEELLDWFALHIMQEDKVIVEYIND